ncbi:allophanate hydrolase [Patulibacter defluvii]|uniref:allophanate hydrolase n=1 Tax=Patulibacter defluvii TaxID=3095358 RepID=UPI002A7551B4|nr:allophanate hydrolase [Patulibacter sp. DM4]
MSPPRPVGLGPALAAVRGGAADPRQRARAARDRAAADPGPSWIALLDDATLDAHAARAAAAGPQAPLAGLTFAIKDNIDLAGTPTTAACPSFAFVPERSATVVEQLIAAGAVPVGKTNLDQFATGLVGTRSPHGGPRSVADPDRISGGSSSGSAVAVARGDVDFALGTDTAGSGRVPAGFNAIVGLKPTRGRLSTAGVLPACASLDCVSLFTRDVDGAATVLDALTRATPGDRADGLADPRDPWSRARPRGWDAATRRLAARDRDRDRRPWRIGLASGALDEDGDEQTRAAWRAAVDHAGDVGEVVAVDLAPFLEAARLLYEGPFVAERYAAVGPFLERDPADADPVVRAIVLGGRDLPAHALFAAGERLRALRAAAAETLAGIDALLVPTAPIHPTAAEVAADPVGVNARLGRFTNGVNLLDLCGLALPGPPRPDGVPFGVTLLAPAWHDELLLELGAHWERALTEPAPSGRLEVVVAGAHMAGLPANPQLVERGGQFERATRTAAGHALRLLRTPVGPRPGLLRPVGGSVAASGSGQIEVELWSIPESELAALAAVVPEGLALGAVRLLDGSARLGFVAAATGPFDPAELLPGGWRQQLADGWGRAQSAAQWQPATWSSTTPIDCMKA